MTNGEKRYDSSRICEPDRAQLRDGDPLARAGNGAGRLQGRDNDDSEHMAHTGIRAADADAEVRAEVGRSKEDCEEAGEMTVAKFYAEVERQGRACGQGVDPAALPSVAFADRLNLPLCAGVYFVFDSNDDIA